MLKRPLKSLYIHIPFCIDKCYYCNFVSFADKNALIKPYIEALLTEIHAGLTPNRHCEEARSADEAIHFKHTSLTTNRHELKTIYIGGGTPSLLDEEYYKLIFSEIKSLCRIAEDSEITLEVNPGTISLDYLKNLRNLGINRLSIGVQSFNDSILKLLNRKHSKNQAIEAVNIAKKAGFDNISIDLIYGLPDQDIKIWQESLEIAANLDIKHISAYGLKIEEGTKFCEELPPNLPEEELAAQMYLKTIEILAAKGFNHYEISNFSKSGYESRHNLSYWRNEEYFGFGLAAHGYVNGVRYSNLCNLEEYINNPLQKLSTHQLSDREIIEEAIFLGLRLIKGINIEQFKNEYGIDLLKEYRKTINKYIDYGFMRLSKSILSLTSSGILISNSILADFLDS